MSHPLWRDARPLVLASGSVFRRALLDAAAIPLDVDPARIDERAVEATLPPDPAAVASGLAAAKAVEASGRNPGRLTLGCDQTLALGARILHKARDRDEARLRLEDLSGRTHHLHSGFALARDGVLLEASVASARLVMRPLSPAMIEAYLDAAGDAILSSVGAYQLEALGVHLFEAIEGDQSTIVGLPMLPVLAALRRHGALMG
jgi:septum formation protein